MPFRLENTQYMHLNQTITMHVKKGLRVHTGEICQFKVLCIVRNLQLKKLVVELKWKEMGNMKALKEVDIFKRTH